MFVPARVQCVEPDVFKLQGGCIAEKFFISATVVLYKVIQCTVIIIFIAAAHNVSVIMNGLYRTSVECPDREVRISGKIIISVFIGLDWRVPLLTVIISEQDSSNFVLSVAVEVSRCCPKSDNT